MPSFTTPIHEANDCHAPAGTGAGGQFCSDTGVPPEPGSTPIPPGKIRGYHYTRDFAGVMATGLSVAHARGRQSGEPDTIWFSTKRPPDTNAKSYVEVFLDPDEIVVGRMFDQQPTQEQLDRFNAGYNNFTTRTPVFPPERFVTHQEPWHAKYRALMDRYPPHAPETWEQERPVRRTPAEVMAQFARIPQPEYVKAVRAWAKQVRR